MVAAKKKLASPLKKVVATAATLTPADVVAVKTTITSTVPGKVASFMPSSVNTTTANGDG